MPVSCGSQNSGALKALVVFIGALAVVVLFAIQSLSSRGVLISRHNSIHIAGYAQYGYKAEHKNAASAPNTGSVDYSRRPNHTRTPVILYWQHYFGESWRNAWPMGDLQCGAAIQCRLTDDAAEYTHSDALLFHGRGTPLKIPELSLRPSNQVWVYHNMESAVHMGGFDRTPNIINWTMTYIRGSDINVSGNYGSVRPGTYMGGFDPNKNYLESKSKFAVAVISNCVGYRMKVVKALAKYIDLDLFGGCSSKRFCNPGQSKEECWESMKDYKFYLSFENSACKDYVTEKFYRNALAHAMVPVVLGGANYSDVEIAPPGSYIDATKFSTVRELGEFLKKEGSDQTLYNKYFRWYSNYTLFFQSLEAQLCSLCERLHQSTYTTKSYKDVASWYSTTGKCVPYPQLSDA